MRSFSLFHTQIEKTVIPSLCANLQLTTKEPLLSSKARFLLTLTAYLCCFTCSVSHHSQHKPVCLFTDGRAQNNPHPHPHTHTQASHILFFPHIFSTPTLITAPVYKRPLMNEYSMFSICKCIHSRYRSSRHIRNHRCVGLVLFPN